MAMPSEQSSQHCYRCQGYTLHQRPARNNLVHGLVSMVIWPWVLVWMVAAGKAEKRNWICQKCGASVPPIVSKRRDRMTVGIAFTYLFIAAVVAGCGYATWSLLGPKH